METGAGVIFKYFHFLWANIKVGQSCISMFRIIQPSQTLLIMIRIVMAIDTP